MVGLGNSEFGAKVGQCLEALGGFGMAGLEGFGEDCPVSRALLRCSEVRESFGEDVDLVGREPIDWPAFEHIFRPEPHVHQLVAKTARQSFSAVELGVASERADQPSDRHKHDQRVDEFDRP